MNLTSRFEFTFPDYSLCCPLCEGKNCAVHIGYYYRKVVVVCFTIFTNVPVARLLCNGKGHKKSPHRTFSLLPHMLVPYHQHDLLSMQAAVDITSTKTSKTQRLDSMAELGHNDAIIIEDRQMNLFENIFKNANNKLIASGQFQVNSQGEFTIGQLHVLDAYINSCVNNDTNLFISSAIAPVEQAALDFFYTAQQHCPFFERLFLFGTPSQKRIRLPPQGFT
jgi:hypothetical protein